MVKTKLDKNEFNLLVNDILLQVKPVKLRIVIANRLLEFFDKKEEQIEVLSKELVKQLQANNEQLKQIMNLESQLIKERLRGENK